MIAILSLGAPRPLNLKKGARATHKVLLYSGSLCILAGDSSLEYTLSVPRGEGSTEHEQLLLFFVGSPSENTDRESDCSTVSSISNENSAASSCIPPTDTEDSENDSRGEIVEMSLLNSMEVPTVIVTPDDNDITKPPYKDTNLKNLETEKEGLERASDIIMQDTSIVVDQPMPEGQKTDTIIPPQDELEN